MASMTVIASVLNKHKRPRWVGLAYPRFIVHYHVLGVRMGIRMGVHMGIRIDTPMELVCTNCVLTLH